MSNQAERDDVLLKLIAPQGGVVGGTPKILGTTLFVVPEASADADAIFAGCAKGHRLLPKKTGETWAVGDPLFWSASDAAFTTTPAAGLLRCGKCTEAAESDDTSGWVLFDGRNAKFASFKSTTASLTAAAGATQDLDVAIVGATAATIPQVSVAAYAGTGFPVIAKVVGGTDKITVTLANIHASAALNAVATLNVTID